MGQRKKSYNKELMQFGMPTLIELDSPETCAGLCRELGLAFIELNMNLPEYQSHKLDLLRLRDIAYEHSIYYTIHLDENLNPFDFNQRVARAYTETVLQMIETAKQLPAPILNMHMHSGVRITLPNRKLYLFDEYEFEYLEKLTVFRDLCTKAVDGANIKICIENCGDFADKPFIRKGINVLLESPIFALTFDIGHNAAVDYTDEPVIMEHRERLCHMHIHDAKNRDNHLILGKGDIDLMKYLDLTEKSHCRAVLEVKTAGGLRQSVAWLKERGCIS
jgi:sugar phosphate isomerase/epimerase